MENLLPAKGHCAGQRPRHGSGVTLQSALDGAGSWPCSPLLWLLISLETNLSPGSGRGSSPLKTTKASALPEVSQGQCSNVTSVASRQRAKGHRVCCWTCPTELDPALCGVRSLGLLGWECSKTQHTGMARSLNQHSPATSTFQGNQSSSMCLCVVFVLFT